MGTIHIVAIRAFTTSFSSVIIISNYLAGFRVVISPPEPPAHGQGPDSTCSSSPEQKF